MNHLTPLPEDHREPRDWSKAWLPKGFFIPGCYCCGTFTGGYWVGGTDTSGARTANAEQFSFATEASLSKTTANLTAAKNLFSGLSDAVDSAYWFGGTTGAIVASTDKTLLAAATTAAATTANLSTVRDRTAAVSERSTKGYIGGGESSVLVEVVTADKITFSGDSTAAATTANLSQARFGLASVTEGSSKGFFFGGVTNITVRVATADKLTYATDSTAAASGANLTIARNTAAGLSNGSTAGYISGGASTSTLGGLVVTTDKITFSADTTAAQTTANLPVKKGAHAAMSAGSDKGFWSGGTSSIAALASTDKIDFPTEVTSAVGGAALVLGRQGFAGASQTGL